MFIRDILIKASILMFILPDLKMIWKLNFNKIVTILVFVYFSSSLHLISF